MAVARSTERGRSGRGSGSLNSGRKVGHLLAPRSCAGSNGWEKPALAQGRAASQSGELQARLATDFAGQGSRA